MASQDWFEKDFYAILGVPQDADAATIKKTYRKLARTHAPRPQRRGPQGRGALQGGRRGVCGPLRPRAAPRVRRDPRHVARRRPLHGGRPGGRRRRLRGHLLRRSAVPAVPAGGGASASTPAAAAQPNLEDILGADVRRRRARCAATAATARRAARGPAPTSRRARRIGFRDAVEGSTVSLSSPDLGRINARIPAGVKDGQRIRLRGKGRQGDPGARGRRPLLTVAVDKHPVFGRDGDNLRSTVPVTFAEAALGATDRGAHARRRRSRSRWPPAPRAAGSCGSRDAASSAATTPATSSPRCRSSCRSG